MTWSSIQNKGSGCITNHTFLGLLAKIKCIVSVLISLIFDRWGKSDYGSLVPGFSRVALVLDCSLGWHTPSKTNLKFIMFAINQSKLDFFICLCAHPRIGQHLGNWHTEDASWTGRFKDDRNGMNSY